MVSIFKYKNNIVAFVIFICLSGSAILAYNETLLSGKYFDDKHSPAENTSFIIRTPSNNIDLLTRNDLDSVIMGAAAGHIPENKINITTGSKGSDFPAYKIILTANQNKNIQDYLYHSADQGSSANITASVDNWTTYGYSEGSDIAAKNGYACLYNYPNRFSKESSLECADVNDPAGAKQEDIKNIIKDLFTSAGLPANINMPISKSNESISIPISEYSKEMLYFTYVPMSLSDEDIADRVNESIAFTDAAFQKAGWKTKVLDSTQTEVKWSKGLLSSTQLIAQKDSMDCLYEITISPSFVKTTDIRDFKYGRREMIDCSKYPAQ